MVVRLVRIKKALGMLQMGILPIEVSLLRFTVILIVCWVMSYAAMNANPVWVVETYVPWSFWLLLPFVSITIP